jgi:phosphoribosylformylglycinamidine cyclo-ligase
MAGKHDTVGQCLVNHCVNDILACGARPLFFLDYFATGRLERGVARDVIKGMAEACLQNGAALLGGETAEMPSLYKDGDYDVAGTIVGVVDKPKILNGSRVAVGDVLIGLPSTGLHTNGFSLARAALFPTYRIDQYVDAIGMTVAEALLAVHASYLKVISPLLDADLISGLSHITGGGIVGNTSRILQPGQSLQIEWGSWNVPEIFRLVQHAGLIEEEEMRHVFNLGVGMIMIVHPDHADTVLGATRDEGSFVLGHIATA